MKIEITEQFLKDLYACDCMPDVKAALEKNFGEVVKPESTWPADPKSKRLVFVTLDNDYAGPFVTATSNEDTKIISLNEGGGWMGKFNDPNMKQFMRPMRSGTITITVKDGKVAGATVQED